MTHEHQRDRGGEHPRAEAARAGLNQSDLARKLGIAQTSISLRWRGKRPWPLDMVEEVAQILGVDTLSLLRARRDSNPQPSDPEDAQPMLDLSETDDTPAPDVHELAAAA